MIPGFIISILTFPGVIVHELAHQICCRICGVVVYQVKYFQFQNPCGYVIHENVTNPWKNLCMALGPFFINTIIGMLIASVPAFCIMGDGEMMYQSNPLMSVLNIVLLWLGISILMHAFPSTGDAKSLVQTVLKNKEVGIGAKIITAPFIGLIYLGAVGSVFWLDLIYGIAMSMLLPNLMSSILYR